MPPGVVTAEQARRRYQVLENEDDEVRSDAVPEPPAPG
jgi:hypothetical protein